MSACIYNRVGNEVMGKIWVVSVAAESELEDSGPRYSEFITQ